MMARLSQRLSNDRAREFLGFSAVGAVNTLLTYLLYLLLEQWMHYTIAFSVAYVVGIFLSYALNSKLVFKQRLHWSKAVQYPLVYLVQYVMSVGLLFLLVDRLRIDSALAPLVVVVLTLPVIFFLSRFVIKREV